MKKVIRLKVKQILSIISISLSIAMVIYFSLPSIMLKMGDRFNHSGNLLKAKGYYDKIDKHFPESFAAETALEKAGYIAAVNDKIMISSSGFGNVQHSIPYIFPEAKAYYEEIIDRFPYSHTAQRIKYDLLSRNIQEKIDDGYIEEAIDTIKDFYTQINNEERKYIDIYKIKGILKAFEVNGYYNEVEELLNWIIEYEDDWRKIEFENQLYKLKSSEGSYGKVDGNITLDQQPFKNVPVFLQYQDMEDSIIYGFTDEVFWTKTDKSGNFEFANVPEGRYTIGLLTDLELVGDKILKGAPFKNHSFNVISGDQYNFEINFVDKMKVITPINGEEINEELIKFQWEPLEETAYYSITLGISYNGAVAYRDFGEKYYNTEALVKKEDILYLDGLLSFDEEGPIPESFFSYSNPKVQLFWGVNAYDKNGNMLSSSNGYVKGQNTDFSLGKTKLTEGDKKLLKRDYSGAIKNYEEILEKNPKDVHSLLMLARLYDFDENLSNYSYTNKERSEACYKKLYEITNNKIFLEKF